MTVTELTPDLPSAITPTKSAAFNMAYSGNGKCRLSVDMEMPMEIGIKIVPDLGRMKFARLTRAMD